MKGSIAMAYTTSDSSTRTPKYQLTLTKAEIAFINFTIELMLEEQRGRTESVTIAVDSAAAAAPKALIKTARQINKWVERNGGWLAVAGLAADFIFGFTSASSTISREQAETLDTLRGAAERGVTLDELIELRDRLEGQELQKVKSSKSSHKAEHKQTKESVD
jgi:hypothetical protein